MTVSTQATLWLPAPTTVMPSSMGRLFVFLLGGRLSFSRRHDDESQEGVQNFTYYWEVKEAGCMPWITISLLSTSCVQSMVELWVVNVNFMMVDADYGSVFFMKLSDLSDIWTRQTQNSVNKGYKRHFGSKEITHLLGSQPHAQKQINSIPFTSNVPNKP